VNWRRALVGVLAVIPLVGLLAFGLTRDPKEIISPLPGRPAPDFALQVFSLGDTAQASGAVSRATTFRLAALRGDVVVLNFWASWCLACRDEHRELSSVATRYAGQGVHFLGVLYNDRPANGIDWIKEMGGQTYPALDDPRTRTAIDYGVYGVPETFFIGRDGRVARKAVGPVSVALLTHVIDSLLAVRPAGP
jgi:cytochrome c biogenesis protein CcmG/thiol:disulfide interchange protein DsbE